MKYFILSLIVLCASCNHVKKITDRSEKLLQLKEEKNNDSIAVSEDLTRLQEKYFKDHNKALVISFFPKTTAALNDSIKILDSAGKMIIHMGSNIPAALSYAFDETEASKKDSLASAKFYVSDQTKEQKEVTTKNVDTHSNKVSNRVPWYLVIVILIIAVILFLIKKVLQYK